jgi:hypothetical protein
MMSNESIKVDRIAIRQMLEDGFRSQLLFQGNYIDTHPRSTRQESIAAGQEFFRRFWVIEEMPYASHCSVSGECGLRLLPCQSVLRFTLSIWVAIVADARGGYGMTTASKTDRVLTH